MAATKMKLGDSEAQNVSARIKIILVFIGEHLGAVGYAIVLLVPIGTMTLFGPEGLMEQTVVSDSRPHGCPPPHHIECTPIQ